MDENDMKETHELSSAMRLLLLCCAGERSVGQEKSLRAMVADFSEWDLLSRLALKNRVFPLVYRTLSLLDGVVLDAKTIQLLRTKCEENRMRSLRLATELVRLMGLFDASDIRAISLKGPALGLALYGDISLRASRDIDILVGHTDFKKAEKLLHDAGYSEDESLVDLSAKQRRFLERTLHHFSYINKTGVTVELHWQYYEASFYFCFNELWSTVKVFTVFGGNINVLCGEENFLYLVFHGTKHAWKRLQWLSDINELVKKGGLDWAYIATRAEQYRTTYMIGQAFVLLKRLFGTEPPSEIKDMGVIDPVAVTLASRALPFIVSDDELSGSLGHSLYREYNRYMLEWQKGLWRKIRFFCMHFYPTYLEFKAIRINDDIFFLYYFVLPYFKLQRLIKSSDVRKSRENAD